jgi:hypothetical protein
LATASGESSVALGRTSTSSGIYAVAIGRANTAAGESSFATGRYSDANGYASYVAGSQLIAESAYEMVVGRFDTDYTPNDLLNWDVDDRLFVVGNGTGAGSRSDAMVILKNGNTGIGTSTPNALLDVNADALINGLTVGRGGGNIGTNTATGAFALSSNIGGIYNNAYGYSALSANTDGDENTATGSGALVTNTTGSYNSAYGNNTLRLNIDGEFNTAIGRDALFNNTTGDYSTAIGAGALYLNTTGTRNTAIGSQALFNNTGNNNTSLGYDALFSNTTGSNNIAIGYNAQVPNGTLSDQVRIGNTSVTYAGVQVAWTYTSDKRWKSDIQSSELGLNFISKLRPVQYYRTNDEGKKTEYGFIAQELEEALNNAGATNNGIISKDDEGMYGVRYNDLIAPMVKGMQEQQEMIENSASQLEVDQLRAENEALRSRLDKMEVLLKELAK